MDQSATLIETCRNDVDRLLDQLGERSPSRPILQSVSDRLANAIRELNVEQRAADLDVRTVSCSASAAKRALRTLGNMIIVGGSVAQLAGVTAADVVDDLRVSSEQAVEGISELQICLVLSSESLSHELDRLLDEVERATVLAKARLREMRPEIPQPSLISNLDYAASLGGRKTRPSTARSELGISLHNLKSIGEFAGLGRTLDVRARIDAAMDNDVLVAQLESLLTTLDAIGSEAEQLRADNSR